MWFFILASILTINNRFTVAFGVKLEFNASY